VSHPKHRLTAILVEQLRRAKRQARRPATLHEFVKTAWPLVVPNAELVDNWHLAALCDHLEAQSRGQLPRLVINVPPGSSKSTTVCVMWPCWEWTWNPGSQWQFGAYVDTLAVRDSIRCRGLWESDWYRDLYGDKWAPVRGRWLANWLQNTKGGIRQALGVGGSPTGFHAHRQVVDDAIKPLDAHSPAALARCERWWFETMASRVLPGNNSRTIIMQRVHDRDLAGIAKEQGYAVLSIPMRYSVRAKREPTPLGWLDPRTTDGELLCPARWNEAEVERRKKEFGPDGWAAQDQQDPVPEGGAIYRAEWFKNYYLVRPRTEGGLVVISFDCAFKSHETSSYVAGQVWLYKPPYFYLLDEIRDHLDFLGTVAAARTLIARYPEASAVLIEDKANGPAVIEVLRAEVPGIIAIEPDGSKIARAYATQPVFASSSVRLPDPSLAPWVLDWALEHTRFPRGVANDRIDAQTQAIRWCMQGGMGDYLAGLEALPA
jgi:predicted phage terminase large subunit-like protein